MINQVCKYIGATGILNCENEFESVANLEAQFVEHINEHGLSYATKEEYDFRMSLYTAKDAQLNEINANPENTFEVGHNKFSTMTTAEISRMAGRKQPTTIDENVEYEAFDESTLEANVDWRSKGAVNSVQDQGSCGSCWAFSTTAAVEGAHKIRTGQLIKLSESQLVDCDRGDDGCGGGMEPDAMKYLKSNAQELERDYPYHARKSSCKYSSSKGKVKVTQISKIQGKNASALKASIAKGPTCVGVAAGDTNFHHYRNGILNKCSKTRQDHAITAVGYGSNFFIVRNSWGSSWGERGYVRISSTAGGSGVCGILGSPITRPGTN